MINKFAFSKGIFSFVLLSAVVLMSNQTAFSQYVCQPSGSPVTSSGSIAAGDPTQAGRVVRDARPSACPGKTNGLQNSTAVRYDSYTFTPTVSGCATVNFDNTGCGGTVNNSTELVAYSNYNPASPATNVIGDPGFSSIGTGSFSFSVTSGVSFTVVVHEITAGGGCANYNFTTSYSTNCRLAGFDRTNDGKADYTVFRPSNGFWYTLNSAGGTNAVRFGQSGDITTAGDYTGDGQTDVSVYRPSNNFLYYGTSQTNPETMFGGFKFGAPGDIPVPGDYDRDGKTDVAVWRPSNGAWYVARSSDNTFSGVFWGQNGDVPVIGDFDGDRINDYAVVRPNDPSGTAVWYVLESNFNFGFILQTQFGTATDKYVPGDYDGDGKTDIAVFRPSNGVWYILRSGSAANVAQTALTFGQMGDIPQPADYDGDKKTDIAVFRPGASAAFFVNNSSTNTPSGVAFGSTGDEPATSPYKVQ